MARERVRAIALCEDARHRSFLIRLLDQVRIENVRYLVAPAGLGSAEQWVRERFAAEARAFRAQANHQANLVLIVMIDGDRFGVAARKTALNERLTSAGAAVRGHIVFLVPTWSIETWLVWLCGVSDQIPNFDEASAYKDHPTVRRLIDDGAISARVAVANWMPPHENEANVVPSLVDARAELTRLP